MKSLAIISLAFLGTSAMAQVLYQGGGNQPTAQPATPAPTNNTQTVNYGNQQDAKSLYGNELPFLNPQDGTITLNGQSFTLGGVREIEARFNKYLSELEEGTKEATEYQKIINKIYESLSVKKIDANAMKKTVDLLYQAASNPLDGGVSDSLAQSMYTAVLARQGGNNKDKEVDMIEKELNRIANSLKLMEGGYQGIPLGNDTKDGNKDNKSTKRDDPRYVYLTKRAAELQAQKLKLGAERTVTLAEAKVMYQAGIIQLFGQRRFDHVSIACRAYSRLFSDGDTQLKIDKDSDAAKIFGGTLGIQPTVAIVDNMSREIARDSAKHMKAVSHLVDSGNYVDALERLQEAHLIGEFMAPVSTFSFEKKQKLYNFKRDVEKLFECMNGKDFGEALKLVDSLKSQAKDFPTGKAESAISASVFASDACITQGWDALHSGDKIKLEECIGKAISIWPKNPKLMGLRDAMMQASQSKSAVEGFKRYYKDKDFRKIYDNQYEFALLVKDDPELNKQFKEVINNIMKIERSLAAAREREAMDDVFGAWEELTILRENEPELFRQDAVLSDKYLELTPKASRLSDLLNQAKTQKAAGEVGSALSKYMEAKKLYIHSRLAKRGLDELLEVVLPMQ